MFHSEKTFPKLFLIHYFHQFIRGLLKPPGMLVMFNYISAENHTKSETILDEFDEILTER